MDGFQAARIGREDRRAAGGPARHKDAELAGWGDEYRHGYEQEHHAMLVDALFTTFNDVTRVDQNDRPLPRR